MQHDHVLKKLNYDPSPRVRRVGDCRQNNCYHVAVFVIPFNLMQHDHVLIKLDFDLWTPFTSLFELGLNLMMLDPSVKFERNL